MKLFSGKEFPELLNNPNLSCEHDSNYLQYKIQGAPFTKWNDETLNKWAKELSEKSQRLIPKYRIDEKTANEIVENKLRYWQKEILSLEKRKTIKQWSNYSAMILSKKYNHELFGKLSVQEAQIQILAHDRHVNTDYDERLAEATRMQQKLKNPKLVKMYKKEGDLKDFSRKEYARSCVRRYEDAKYITITTFDNTRDYGFMIKRKNNEFVMKISHPEELFRNVDLNDLAHEYAENSDDGQGLCHGLALEQAKLKIEQLNKRIEDYLNPYRSKAIHPLNSKETQVAIKKLAAEYEFFLDHEATKLAKKIQEEEMGTVLYQEEL